MDPHRRRLLTAPLAAVLVGAAARTPFAAPPPVTLLNVSYDPTRELYVHHRVRRASGQSQGPRRTWRTCTAKRGQDIIGRHHYRPAVSAKAQAKYAAQFPKIKLFSIEEAFGNWEQANRAHFADGGSFDQIHLRK